MKKMLTKNIFKFSVDEIRFSHTIRSQLKYFLKEYRTKVVYVVIQHDRQTTVISEV